ncbi:MAG TPA: AAA family ATPase, partial [Solirubrobacteraceae bacterium]|nr:AAA family ATPase [Solirubrobacteraceae bacterium]
MFGAGAAMLLEREKELEALSATIAGACDGEGGLLLVEGGAGCGKSELIVAADDVARESGAFALVAHASELERDDPFGVVVQLLAPALAAFSAAERAELVDGPARLAAP